MMNVRWIQYLLILIFGALMITGCEDPSPSIASLGKKFQAPSLTGASPFDQDMNTNGYVRFQGSCNPRVTTISLSFDSITWFMVPAAPSKTGTTLTGSEVNDASCENDGHFDFYLTKSDLTGWGLSADVNVDFIYIRGNTPIGDTHVLIIQDPHPGSGNGGTNGGVASQVRLEKNWPKNFAGSNQCEAITASVRDANNNFVTAAAAVTFSLDKKIDSTAVSTIEAFSTLADCTAARSQMTVFTIAAGKNSLDIYYRLPTTPINGAISFRASAVSLTTTTSPYIDVVLRDSTTGIFWIASYSPYKVGSGMCTKANFDARLYNGTAKYLNTAAAWKPIVTGTNSTNLFFYSDATCANKVTAIDATSGNNTFYFKYTGTEIDNTNLTFTLGHEIDVATFGNYDDITQTIQIDRSGNTTLSFLDFFTSDIMNRAVCNQTQIQTHNSQGTLVTPNTSVTLAASGNTTFFETQADCDTGAKPITTLLVTNPQTVLYYRVLSAPSTTQTITMTATGLPTAARSFVVSDKATTVTALFDGVPKFIYPAANVCTLMKIETILSDSSNDGTPYMNNFGENKSVTVQIPTGYTVYTNADCSTAAGGNSMSFAIGTGTWTSGVFNFYIKADSVVNPANFYISQSTGGASGYLGSSQVPLIIGP